MKTRREIILLTVADLVEELLNSGRKDDEDLPRGAIETAVRKGEISKVEIVQRFADELDKAL